MKYESGNSIREIREMVKNAFFLHQKFPHTNYSFSYSNSIFPFKRIIILVVI